MTVTRPAAALIATLAIVLSPSAAAAASSPLSPTPPSWLAPTPTSAPPAAPPAAPHLPKTGLDLMPEALAGIGLLAAGAGLRLLDGR